MTGAHQVMGSCQWKKTTNKILDFSDLQIMREQKSY